MLCPPLSHVEPENGSVSEQELNDLKGVFDICDENGDGYLTLEELCKWMDKLGLFMTMEGMSDILRSGDHNLDGRLDFEEFVDISSALMPSNHEPKGPAVTSHVSGNETSDKGDDASASGTGCKDPELQEAFHVFDKDRNGLISPGELKSTLSQLGLLASSTSFSRIHSMIRRVDIDGDGHVSFSEFQTMMRGESYA
ncbi:hypothetical protein KP509_11G089600 [Ceratopteris richardii]|uniref:EF-hand domain-containing protein n=3 Tax=Ceratopteris richardii TaxID=49495 RepID=A0A8T2U0J3_CERRI|nr:hypothetical protein KP509_11G089600 [Ceratopteris richardii]